MEGATVASHPSRAASQALEQQQATGAALALAAVAAAAAAAGASPRQQWSSPQARSPGERSGSALSEDRGEHDGMQDLGEGAGQQRGGRRAATAAGLQRSGSLSMLDPNNWRGEDGQQRGQDVDLDADMDGDDMNGQMRGRRNARQQEQNKQVSAAGGRAEAHRCEMSLSRIKSVAASLQGSAHHRPTAGATPETAFLSALRHCLPPACHASRLTACLPRCRRPSSDTGQSAKHSLRICSARCRCSAATPQKPW